MRILSRKIAAVLQQIGPQPAAPPTNPAPRILPPKAPKGPRPLSPFAQSVIQTYQPLDSPLAKRAGALGTTYRVALPIAAAIAGYHVGSGALEQELQRRRLKRQRALAMQARQNAQVGG